MVDEPAPEAPPDAGSELPPDRCPNCDGPLKSFWDQPEALCPRCGIFVEILRPRGVTGSPAEPVAEGLVHRLGLAKYHLMSEELDEEEIEAEPQQVELEAGPPARYPPAPSAESPPPEPAAGEAPETTAVSVEERGPDEGEKETPESPVPESDAPIPTDEYDQTPPEPLPEPEVTIEEIPPPPEAEAAPEVEFYGEQGSQLLIEEPVEAVSRYREIPPPPMAVAESVQTAARAPSTRPPRPRRSHRVVFYVGGVNVAFGGAVLVFGSFLHDFFRVPLIGQSYNAFGSLNLFAAQLGALFMALGLAAMAAAARRGRRQSRRAAGG
ncbi:MAG TPA: zinc ribbon domain-containing protein [Thermoplasmata archaeon]|nr:zinc ribbon domain-containing protein [Thermoplasmata archaeon]